MQSVRNRGVRQALAQQLGDLALAPRETERIGASADVRPAPKSKRSELAQAAARYVGRGPGTERLEAIERGEPGMDRSNARGFGELIRVS